MSIEDVANLVPPWFGIAVAVVGLVLLTVSALGALQLRVLRTRTLQSVNTNRLIRADEPDPGLLRPAH